jgi:hemerythrin-like domain-containing protein
MEPLEIIEKIIQEHKKIRRDLHHLDRAANDAEALSVMDQAKEVFMPGRLKQHQGLQELRSSMEATAEGLDRHFSFEEEWLPDLVERYGDEEITSNWESLLLEHKDLRNRLAHSRRHVTELIEGKLARHLWEASAHDMRAYITHTRKLMEAHAGIEQELLYEVRNRVKRAA